MQFVQQLNSVRIHLNLEIVIADKLERYNLKLKTNQIK